MLDAFCGYARQWRRVVEFGHHLHFVLNESHHFGVRKGMVDAGFDAVRYVVRSTVDQAVGCTALQKFCIANCGCAKGWIAIGQNAEGWLATVRCATAPVAPLLRTRAPTVVPCSIRQHELKVTAHRFCDKLNQFCVVDLQRIKSDTVNGLFDVVAKIDRQMTATTAQVIRFPFAPQQRVWLSEELFDTFDKLQATIGVLLIVKQLAKQMESVDGCHAVVEVREVDLFEVTIEIAADGFVQSRCPRGSRLIVENFSVVVQGFGECNCAEDGRATPRFGADVVSPTAIVVLDVVLSPVVDVDRGANVFLIACYIRQVQKRIQRVRAASVNVIASRTREGSVQFWVVGIIDLLAHHAIAPIDQQAFGERVEFGADGGFFFLCASKRKVRQQRDAGATSGE